MLNANILYKVCGTNIMLADLNKAYLNTAISIIEGIYSREIDIRQELVDRFINKFGGLDSLKALADEVKDIVYIKDEDLSKFQTIADFIGCFNNTILFRDFKIKSGRNISMINPRIKGRHLEAIVLIHKAIEKFLDITLKKSSSVLPAQVGGTMRIKNIKAKSASSYMPKLDDSYIIKMDISKFYDSVKTSNFLKHDILKYVNPISSELYKLLETIDEESFILHHNGTFLQYITQNQYSFFYNVEGFEGDVNINETIRTNRMVAIFMLSYLMHNNKIPTGAIYSSSLANLYLLSVDIEFCKNIGLNVLKNESQGDLFLRDDSDPVQYFRFMDDVTICIRKETGLAPFNIVKLYERIANKYGLHLKYSKTSIHDMEKSSNIPILGYTYRIVNEQNLRFLESKYRKDILDMIKDGGYSNFDLSKKGKLAYAMSAESSFKDIMLHYNYNEKLKLFNSDRLKFKFNEKIYNVKFEGLHIKDIINSVKDPNFPSFQTGFCTTRRHIHRRMDIQRKNLAIRYILQFMMSPYNDKHYRIIDISPETSDSNGNGIRIRFSYSVFKNPNSASADCFRIPFSILDKMKIEESTLNEGDILIDQGGLGSLLRLKHWNIDNYKVEHNA